MFFLDGLCEDLTINNDVPMKNYFYSNKIMWFYSILNAVYVFGCKKNCSRMRVSHPPGKMYLVPIDGQSREKKTLSGNFGYQYTTAGL